MKKIVIVPICLCVILFLFKTWACGPHLPANFLVGNEIFILSLPRTLFAFEMERMAKPESNMYGFKNIFEDYDTDDRITGNWEIAYPTWSDSWKNTLEAESCDVRDALLGKGMDPSQVDLLTQQYLDMRAGMKQPRGEYEPEPSIYAVIATNQGIDALVAHENILKELPQEFVLYAKGAAAYRANHDPAAFRYWQELLALPPEQRHYRSTWAAYMIGKACLVNPLDTAGLGNSFFQVKDATQAITFFQQAQQLAREGFADTLELAQDSEGWIAHAEMVLRRYKDAIHRYYPLAQQRQAGGWLSLDFLCRRIYSKPMDDIASLAEDALCRKVLLNWVMSQKGNYDYDWIKPLEEKNVPFSAEEADQIAWLAYREADFEKAKKWLAKSETHTPEGQWVLSRLLLREGKVDQAMQILHALVPVFAGQANTDVLGSLGVLHLGQKEYVEALDAFLRAHFWVDAAYVAEYMVLLKELESYVKGYEGDYKEELGNLLARRLVRNRQWEKAKVYFSDEFRSDLESFLLAYQKAENSKLAKSKRIAAYFEAAQWLHMKGMEIMGTETDPDWYRSDGRYDFIGPSETRGQNVGEADNPNTIQEEESPTILTNYFHGSPDEKARIQKNAPVPNKRFHYRYVAAELLWKCAKLLPDNNPETDRALWTAGQYLKRDPEAAEKFYMALVRRCRDLSIGQEADRLRWFPASLEISDATE